MTIATGERSASKVPRLVNIRVDIHSDDEMDGPLFDDIDASTETNTNTNTDLNTTMNTPTSNKVSNGKLSYGVATPGTMPKIAAFSSPLDFFTRSPNPAASTDSPAPQTAPTTATTTDDDDDDDESQLDIAAVGYGYDDDTRSIITTTSHAPRLGIGRFPEEEEEGDDFQDDVSVTSHRIGIRRPDYSSPQGEFPLSPDVIFAAASGASNTNPPHVLDLDDQNGHLTEDEALARLYSLTTPTTPTRFNELPPDDPHAIMPNDGIPRLIHPHTHQGSFLVNSPTLDAPSIQIRYGLTDGKQGMTESMRAEKVRPLQMGRRPDGTPVDASWEDSFKIFILLMHPKKKIFELIQVLYKPSTTTVEDLMRNIPVNATEPALGIQSYNGLCRPQDTAGRMLPLSWMASSGSTGKISARILRGEILVAVPKGYSGELCAKLSKPILEHKRLTKLLHKKDPLGAPKSRRSRHKSKRSTVTTVVEEGDEQSAGSSTATPIVASAASSPAVAKTTLTPKQSSLPVVTSPLISPSGWHLAGNAAGATDDESSAASSVKSTLSGLGSSAVAAVARGMIKTKDQKKAETLLQMAASCFTVLVSVFTQLEELEDDEGDDPMDRAVSFLGFLNTLVFLYLAIRSEERKKRQGKSAVLSTAVEKSKPAASEPEKPPDNGPCIPS